MNKTVNINLGGMFFHIDEDAYQKLSQYFDAIKNSLNNSSGQDEIIKDIEMRIAELFLEKNNDTRQVISMKEVEKIISIMGQPEDYRLDHDEHETKHTYHQNNQHKSIKKLYRDTENNMIGGVMAGLGHYFGIDKVWLRIIMVILLLTWGVGLLPYIILWIVMPEARTTAEKLEMTGEPVNISSIEKKVKESFDSVSNKFKNTNFDQMGNQIKTGADKVAGNAGNVFVSVFKIISKIFGIFLILGTLPVLVLLIISVVFIGSTEVNIFRFNDLVEASNYLDIPLWSVGLIIFFLIGIPVFYIMILGFRLVITKMKSLGAYFNVTLLVIWIISLIGLFYILVTQSTQMAVTGKVIKTYQLKTSANDTIYFNMNFNDQFANSIDDYTKFQKVIDTNQVEKLFSNDVELKIEISSTKQPYIEIHKEARSSSLSSAKNIAENIQYSYQFDGKNLVLNNYLLADIKQKIRKQRVTIIVYLPENTNFKFDKSVVANNYSYSDFLDFAIIEPNELYTVENNQVFCKTCKLDNDISIEEESEVSYGEEMENSIEANQHLIDSVESVKNYKGLIFDKNGKVIKKQ